MTRYGWKNIYKDKATVKTLLTVFISLAASFLLSACATPSVDNKRSGFDSEKSERLYRVTESPATKGHHNPAFLVKNPQLPYNRIGTPSVRKTQSSQPEIYVAPDPAALFIEEQEFTGAKGSYQNLIFRVHFEQVPFGLSSINITTGKNPGLLIIYTLNQNKQLLLVTTLQSCGCFLAFFPTDNLAKESFPKDWPEKGKPQWVYGYTLPSLLTTHNHSTKKDQDFSDPEKLIFTLESETHRISNVSLHAPHTAPTSHETMHMDVRPMDSLYRLPYNNTTESFFEIDGPRRGYVRNNLKILERLFISWWALDLYVGEDKAFGAADKSEIPLYTSLKFWNRQASDLKDFPRFLAFWGWKF